MDAVAILVRQTNYFPFQLNSLFFDVLNTNDRLNLHFLNHSTNTDKLQMKYTQTVLRETVFVACYRMLLMCIGPWTGPFFPLTRVAFASARCIHLFVAVAEIKINLHPCPRLLLHIIRRLSRESAPNLSLSQKGPIIKAKIIYFS